MVTLKPEEVLALRREEQELPREFPMLRQLLRKLGRLSVAGQPVQITIAESPPQWLTTADVAAMFQVSERAVRHWCEEHRIVATQIPGARGVWHIPADQFPSLPTTAQALIDTVTRINQRFDGDPPEDYER